MTAAPHGIEPETLLENRYRVKGIVSSGGMGSIFEAEDILLNRTVAIKTLLPELTGNSEENSRFGREAKILATLVHPNICTFIDWFVYRGVSYIVMEYLEGMSLRQVIEQNDLSVAQKLVLLLQICSGLQAAHEKGIVHRDLKPNNFMLIK